MSVTALGVNSEVGALRVVILHRPGAELQRLTPRNNDALLFDGLPWVARAQEEHDAFADLLRSRGVEVLLLSDLLTEALSSGAARMHGISAAVDSRRLGLPSGAATFGVSANAGPASAGAYPDGGHDVHRAAVRRR